MKQYFIEKYRAAFTSHAINNVANFRMPVAGIITGLNFRAPTIVGAGWVYTVRKNGAAIGATATLGEGTRTAAQTGLAIAVAAGDIVSVDLTAYGTGGTWSGFEFTATMDDGVTVPADIADLADVDLTGLADGDVLVWDEGTETFKPGSAASAIANLTDVDLSGLADGYVLVYDLGTTTWTVAALPAAGATNLDGLSDVVITTPATGDVLQNNGSHFVNVPETGLAIAGDVHGSLGVSQLAAINGRPTSGIPVYAPLTDGFDYTASAPDPADWNLLDGGTGMAAPVGSGYLEIHPTLSGGRYVYYQSVQTFDPTGKSFIFDINEIVNIHPATFSVFFGFMELACPIIPQYGPDAGGKAFFVSKTTGVGLSGPMTVQREAGNDASAISGTTNLSTVKVRLRHDAAASRMKCDFWNTGTLSWDNQTSWNYGTGWGGAVPTNVAMFVGVFSSPGSGADVRFNEISTDAISDSVADQSAVVWDGTTKEFKLVPPSENLGFIPTTSGPPSGAPAGLPAGHTQLQYDPTSHTLYAWNGATWDDQVF